LKDGITKYYFPNGNVSDFQTYKNNLLDGKCFTYDESGKIISSTEYKEGELVK